MAVQLTEPMQGTPCTRASELSHEADRCQPFYSASASEQNNILSFRDTAQWGRSCGIVDAQ